jgi:hypothetical protein
MRLPSTTTVASRNDQKKAKTPCNAADHRREQERPEEGEDTLQRRRGADEPAADRADREQQQDPGGEVRREDHPRGPDRVAVGDATEGAGGDRDDGDPGHARGARTLLQQARFEDLGFGEQFPLVDVDAEVGEPPGRVTRCDGQAAGF